MNIIFLEAVQNFGGARKSTLELASRLTDEHNVLVVDFWGCSTEFIHEAERMGVNITFLEKRNTPILLSNRKLIIKIINYVLYIKTWYTYKKKFDYIQKSFHADLVIVNNTKTLSILTKASKYKIAYFARGWFLPQTIGFFERFLIKNLSTIYIGVAQATRHAIFAGGFAPLNKIFTVPNAIDFEQTNSILNRMDFRPWNSEGVNRPFIILHCGGFLPTKGQELIIELAEILRNEDFNFKIRLVGVIYKGHKSNLFYQYIRDLIDSKGLINYFEFIVNQYDVLKCFAQCDVLVHPSHTEGLPRVVMEAMSFGKPVIGNPVGGMTDYILNNYTGILTNHNSVGEYFDAIKSLYYDKDRYATLSENAKNLIIQNYQKNNQLREFLNAIRQIESSN